MKYNSIVFSDFDGTITAEETFAGVLRKYAQIPYQEVERRLVSRELSLREGVRKLVESIPSKYYPEIMDYVAGKSIRAGFPQLLDYLAERQVPFVIVSGGLKAAIIHRLGDLTSRIHAIYAADVKTDGEYLELHSEFEGGTELVAKAEVMASYTFNESIAIGDGLSDLNMALKSDMVFARDTLRSYLQAQGKPYLAWQDFHDVRHSLSRYWSSKDDTTVPRSSS